MLDTNICIYLIKKRPASVLRHISRLSSDQLYISLVTCSELFFGVYNSTFPEKNLKALQHFLLPLTLLPYPPEAAQEYGNIRADLKKRGRLIGPMDLLIAAHAVHHKLILVTNNTEEFSRVKNLKIENWVEE